MISGNDRLRRGDQCHRGRGVSRLRRPEHVVVGGGAPTEHGSTLPQVAQVERVSRHPAGWAVADSGRLRYVPANYRILLDTDDPAREQVTDHAPASCILVAESVDDPALSGWWGGDVCGAGGTSMICRIWHGWTTRENADAYERTVRSDVIPGIEAMRMPGFRHIDLMRRELDDQVEFVTAMWFDDVDSIKAFMGDDYTVSHVPATARAVLARYDQRAAHYAVIDRRQQPSVAP
jgi:hypothetical protein